MNRGSGLFAEHREIKSYYGGNEMRTLIKMSLRGIMLGFLFGTLSWLGINAALSEAAETGVSEKEITIGMVADSTGPIAIMGKSLSIGAITYFDAINQAGGIHGRKIRFLHETDDYQPSKHVAALRKLVSLDKVFCFISNMGTSNCFAALPIIQQEGIPVVCPQSGLSEEFMPPKSRWWFLMVPPNDDVGRSMVEYVAQVLKKRGARVGLLYQDDDTGQAQRRGVIHQVNKYLTINDMKLVGEESYKRAAADVTPQITKLKDSNPDVVILCSTHNVTSMALKTAKVRNWKPQFAVSYMSDEYQVIQLAGEAAEGLAIFRFCANPTDDFPLVKECMENLKRFGRESAYVSRHVLQAYGAAKITCEALKRAGANPTRESFADALESLRNYEYGDAAPITFTKDNHFGLRKGGFWSIVRNGKLEKLHGWTYVVE